MSSRWITRLALVGCLLLPAVTASAASNLLIWPIDPYLASDASAAELWVQNQGEQAVTMQVRIVGWRQDNGHERYDAQQEVVASPPIVRVEGGQKQLIRLIRQGSVPDGVEKAYRVVVDEIPQPQTAGAPQTGLKIQMRFSIPLFAYGKGIATQPSGNHHAFVDSARLSWRIVNDNGQAALQVTNMDDVHVRLSNVKVQQGGQRLDMAQGLLGYVLPHSTRSWPLPAGATRPTQLFASVNTRTGQWLASPAR